LAPDALTGAWKALTWLATKAVNSAEVLADPKAVERLGELGFVTKPMTSAEFTAFVANQVKAFQAPVKASGAKL
jgi:tripartite-type tricarboxylate transporter receptor subunit TctC